MEQYKDIDFALARLLLRRITSKKGTTEYGSLTYKECAGMLSQELGRTINPHFGLTDPLYRVAELCFELNLPILTALVKSQNGTRETIGVGFYKMLCEFKPECKKMEAFEAWKAERARVRECGDWSPLSDFLSRHDKA